MHSSRMRTTRSLPYRAGVSVRGAFVQGGLCPGGSLSGGGFCPEGYLSRGVSVQGDMMASLTDTMTKNIDRTC